MKRTNVARVLDHLGISYQYVGYEIDPSDLGTEDVARKLDLPLGQVFKTLVARGDKGGVLLACIPGDRELDLKAVAVASGNKRVVLVPVKEIEPLTGYVRGGVSPIGAKKRYPVYLDARAMEFPFISVSAGARGYQIFIAPMDLVRVVSAKVWPLSRRKAL